MMRGLNGHLLILIFGGICAAPQNRWATVAYTRWSDSRSTSESMEPRRIGAPPRRVLRSRRRLRPPRCRCVVSRQRFGRALWPAADHPFTHSPPQERQGPWTVDGCSD